MLSRSTLQCAVTVSRERQSEDAASHLVRDLRAALPGAPDLACLFLSAHYLDRADRLTAVIREELSGAVLIGCSGEGVIAGRDEMEQGPAVSLWAAQLPETKLLPIRLAAGEETLLGSDSPGPSEQEGTLLGSVPPGPPLSGLSALRGPGGQPPVFMIFADPFSTPVDEFLSALGSVSPGCVVIGGLAGGGRDQGENRVLLNGQTYEDGAVIVAITGPVPIRALVSQGCRPTGERFVVTRSEKNVIHELGGRSALERLEEMFHSLSPQEQQLARRTLHIGIAIDEHRSTFGRGDFLIRNLLGVDRASGSLAIGDRLQEGQTVQFQVRDAQSASEDLRVLLAEDRFRHQDRIRGALLFSCCGRGQGMFGRPHHDVRTVLEATGSMPMAGFFAQGEIGPVAGSNFLHGYTASLALFPEPH